MIKIKKSNRWRIHEFIILIFGISTICLLTSTIYLSVYSSKISSQSDFIVYEYQTLINNKSLLVEAKNELYDYSQKLSIQIYNMKIEIEKITREYERYKKETAWFFVNQYDLSNHELQILYQIVESECKGQSFNSKVNVTHTILNRVLNKDFPDTIEGVVFQPNQFDPVYNKSYYNVNITSKTKDAVHYAIKSTDSTQGSLFFMNSDISGSNSKNWFNNNLQYLFTDEANHSFYK